MKKLVLSALVLTLATASVNAQWNGRGNQQKQERRGNHGKSEQARAGERGMKQGAANMTRFYDELNLTSSQRAQADQLNTQFKSEMQSLRTNNSISQEQKRTQMQSLMQRHQAAFRSILTYDQAQRYDALVAEMRSKGAKRQQGGSGGQNTYNGSGLNFTGGSASPLDIQQMNDFSLANLLGSVNLSSLFSNGFSLNNVLGLVSQLFLNR